MPHLLVALDAFTPDHLRALADAVAGWATWERIDEAAPPELYMARLAVADVVVGWPKPAWLLACPVQLVLLPSGGYEEYLGRGLEHRLGLVLCNARGAYSPGVAEHCVAMMLALARQIPCHVREMRDRAWNRRRSYSEIEGATACVVGLGDIGAAIARRCVGLGMQVTGVRRDTQHRPEYVERLYAPEALCEAVAVADHVFCVLPGGPETAGIFSREVFDAMKPGAFFYNAGRGSSVDQEALVGQLQSGRLGGAGLDVFASEPLPAASPLWEMDNVIVTPHVAGYAARYADRLCANVVENLTRYRRGEPLVNVILAAGVAA